MNAPSCLAIRAAGKSRGVACGRRAVGFVAPGHGRCGYHLTERERLRTLAVIRAIREMQELRACPRMPEGGPDDEQDPESEPGADSEAHFDPIDFAGARLDEE